MKLLMLLSLIFTIITTNTNTITGIVTDSNTGEYLVGVKVMTNTDTTYTDLDGVFTLPKVGDSTNIKFEYISYDIKDTIIYFEDALIINELTNKQ
jgi:hypothetical protein